MKEFWNTRYSEKEYVYGIKPNAFLKETIDNLAPSSILLPADGEGRNSVYAATKGWQVTAFDYSEAAKKKALELAHHHQVVVDYQVASVLDFQPERQVEVIGLTFVHLPPDMQELFHQKLGDWLMPNGIVVLEAFHKNQLSLSSGGPKNIAMLFDEAMMKEQFKNFEIEYLKNHTYDLDEGPYHQGKAAVIRLVARKKE